MNAPERITVAVSGASGAIYARLVLESLLRQPGVREIALVITDSGREVARHEGATLPQDDPRIRLFSNDDLFAPPASGSAAFDAMIVAPCSVGFAGRVAAGVSRTLAERAADVMLKERRPLVMLVRETPLSTLHLRNLTLLSECGATIVPACPSFYGAPDGMEQLCRTVTDRALRTLGFRTGYEWNGRGQEVGF